MKRDTSKLVRSGCRFAEKFVSTLLSWARKGVSVEIQMYLSIADRLIVFQFTHGKPHAFVQATNQAAARKLVHRAQEVSPTCNPLEGDLAVFDGKRILMFRTFNESLSLRSARKAAAEIACKILMDRERKVGAA